MRTADEGKPLRWPERMAAASIAAALDVEVVLHDDGTAPSMYDLLIMFPDREPGAVEVTTATDQQAMPVAKRLLDRAEPWRVPELSGSWMGSVSTSTANMRRIEAELPELLIGLERLNVRELRLEETWEAWPYQETFSELGILQLSRFESSEPGVVTLIPEQDQMGGMVPPDGRPVADWLSAWLALPQQADNLSKLAASGADERHLFLALPAFDEAPFEVTILMMQGDAPLPDVPAAMPPEITHVWIASNWEGGAGMRWAPETGWSRFEVRVDEGG